MNRKHVVRKELSGLRFNPKMAVAGQRRERQEKTSHAHAIFVGEFFTFLWLAIR